MNKKNIYKIAKKYTPKVTVKGKKGWLRHDITQMLEGEKNIGIELGVAMGTYSKRMLKTGKFHRFYGVDLYGDNHDTEEYISALKHIGHRNRSYSLLRMDFESALSLFKNEYFDFLYVDGFAHTGEDGGKTLIDWYKKVKVGGIIAGDDYHEKWPLVVWAVNDLAKQLGATVYVTRGKEKAKFCKYPTWFIIKEDAKIKPKLDMRLYKLGMKEKKRLHKQTKGIRKWLRMATRSFNAYIAEKKRNRQKNDK